MSGRNTASRHAVDEPRQVDFGLLSMDEACLSLRCCRDTLRKLTVTGEIPFVRIGTRNWYSRDAIKQWLADGAPKPSRAARNA